MSFENPSLEQIRTLLKSIKTIAMVGYSPKPVRPSYGIAHRLQGYGYRVIPVRPGISEALGEKAYPNLSAVPDAIDLVNVFRSPHEIPAIVDECLRLGLKRIWLQEGAGNEEAAAKAAAAGMTVVMERCIMRDYHHLCRD